MKKHLNRSFSFFGQSFKHFFAIDGPSRASALSYTTLLAIVPLALLGLGLLSGFPAFHEYIIKIENLIIKHFVPSSADALQSYLESIAIHGARISIIGLLTSILTGILLIFTMESSFNSIWKIERHKHRKGIAAFLLYWAVLTLIPILAVCIFAATLNIYSIPLFTQAFKTVFSFLPMLFLLDVFLTWIAFLILYLCLPNTKIKFRHAALGAICGAIIFELMKMLFSYFAKYYFSDLFIYGALAVFPVFLLWLYLSWIVVLFGAVISFQSGAHSAGNKK